MEVKSTESIALVLAAHGDRGGPARNDALEAHAAALRAMNRFAFVTGGVLNGTPALGDALRQAEQSGAEWILVYPLFMSDGYFAGKILPEKIAAAKVKTLISILQPLGLDARVPHLLLESALDTARTAGLEPGETRLLVVGHGSKYGPANADCTKHAVSMLARHSPFAHIDTAFLEQATFLADALRHDSSASVVAGFFSSDGLHGGSDVPAAIEKSGAEAVYTGAIGLHSRIPEFIASSVYRALELPEPDPAPGPAAYAGADNAPRLDPQTHDSPSRRDSVGGASAMRFLFRAVFTLAMMALLAFAAIAFLVPEDVVRDRLAALVKQQTGRDLIVRGKTSFSLFPNVGVELEDVSISNPPGMKRGEVLRMGSLKLNLKLLPLFSREVEIKSFVLLRPVFNLIADGQGRKNWEFQKRSAARATPPRAMMQAQAGGLGGGMVRSISLGTVTIADGVVNYRDEKTGAKQRFDAVNVSLTQARLPDPLDGEGNFVWRGEKVFFNGRLDALTALLRKASSRARVTLSTPRGKADFDGQIKLAGALSVTGALSGETSSLRGLASWLGNPLPPGGGLEAAAISGQVGFKNGTFTFTKARISLDGMKGEGQASMRFKGARLYIKASLALDKLDLNPYLRGPSPGATASRPVLAAPKPGADQSLTDFLDKLNKADEGKQNLQPQVRAWSQRAFDLTGLRAVDADMNITARAVYYNKIKAGKSSINISLKRGLLSANLKRLALYSGTGTGRITVNAARSVPGIAVLFNLQGISALPLLGDAVDFKWISGRANMAISLSGTGRSQSEMMRSMQGEARLEFTDGAIEGINIPAMVRGLKQGSLRGWKRTQREKTDFSRMSGTFKVQGGVATNKDLNLVGPLIRMTGEGTIDLGREYIDYAVLPRLVASLEGQGASDERKGIAVPLRIKGPWDNVKIVPDLKRLLSDPELMQENVKKIEKVLKKLKNKEDLNRLLQGLLGGGTQGAGDGTQGAQPGAGGEKLRAKDLLKQLLR